jgi:hypothetical protein
MLRGDVGYDIAPRQSGPLRDEVDDVRDKWEWMHNQHKRVDQWFKDQGFDLEEIDRDEEIDSDAFERAFAKAFGRRQSDADTVDAPAPPKRAQPQRGPFSLATLDWATGRRKN